MSIYLDSSFVVSAYAVDDNFESAVSLMETTDELLLVSSFCELEVLNALELRVFRKEMTRQLAGACAENFRSDLRARALGLRRLPEFAFERARELSSRNTAKLGIRASDLLHVACALELGAESFYSFDQQQKRLAKSVGLNVNAK